MKIRNINERFGDPVEMDSVAEFEESLKHMNGDENWLPEDGLREGRDYVYVFEDADKAEFIRGFESAAPAGYDAAKDDDGSNPCPWCAPWTWADEADYTGSDPFFCGVMFAKRHYAEIEELLAEDEEA